MMLHNSDLKKYKSNQVFIKGRNLLSILGFSLVITLVMLSYSPVFKDYRLGDYAERDIKSPQYMQIEDIDSSTKNKMDAERMTPPVFDYDPGIYEKLKLRIREAFVEMRKNSSSENAKRVFEEKLGKPVRQDIFNEFRQWAFAARLEKVLVYAVNAVPRGFIVEQREIIYKEQLPEIIVNNLALDANNEKKLVHFSQLSNILTIDEAKERITGRMEFVLDRYKLNQSRLIIDFVEGLVEPNLTFNKQLTLEQKENAKKKVNKTVIEVKKGEIIVREGEQIGRLELLKFEALKKAKAEYKNYIIFLFVLGVLVLALFSMQAYSKTYLSSFMPKTGKDILIIAVLLFLFTILLRWWFFLASVLDVNIPSIPKHFYLFLFPYISLPLIVRVLINPEMAVLITIFGSLITGIMNEQDFALSLYALYSGLMALVFVRRFEERSVLLLAGLKTGAYQMVISVAIVMGMVNTVDFSWSHIPFYLLAGMFSGLLSAVITEGLVPFVEYFFNYTTNIKLLEVANSNHPLMRELIIRAPGTYHHSMIVGQLASAGAEEIGANALLTRVGSYYHDIGKMGKSAYFIENQQGIANPHDRLNPSMSAMILLSHVKDGVKMIKEFKLGEAIQELIEQHHGTSLMQFFYNKALEADPNVNDLDYRYPGPKPRTREAALVMIADSCEAACRSLEEPTPQRIQVMVDKIINKLFTDGQFDECDITLNRLKTISQIYTKILVALHHARIDYPEQPAESADKSGDKRYGDNAEKRRWDKAPAQSQIPSGGSTEGSSESAL
jgi:cyclic-di-AMP phosphodiesterase PgpH